MLNVAEEKAPISIDADQLLSRTFTFKVEPQNSVISEDFVFHQNGFLIGYSHANETYWELDGNVVNILDADGRVTCQLSPLSGAGEAIRLGGYFRNPMLGYEETANFHVLEENASDSHTRIQSFDLFDTLVARRCYDPLEVFRIVERKAAVPGFADWRHKTEMSIFGRRPYGIDDIYLIMVSEGFITQKQAAVLRWMELEEEWEHLFPIGDVVARVGANDIVISDMYLPRPFIERVLREKCGLKNRLYLSNYGKHHRQIWPEILSNHNVRTHFGDNIQADIISPASFGIDVALVSISKWDQTEQVLHAIGLGAYAHAVREARLRSFHPSVAVRHAKRAQASINIPLMLLASFWLKACAQERGVDKILMAARDCNLWQEMLASRHFARANMPPSEYIRISRAVCYTESVEYEAYLQNKLGLRNLLVDFVGTGKSLGTIIDRMERRATVTPCILLGEPRSAEIVETLPETFLLRDFTTYRVFFEALNASLEGSTVLTVPDNYRLAVLLQENEFSDVVKTMIGEMRSTFQHFMRDLDRIDPPRNPPSLDILRQAGGAIVELLPAWSGKLSVLEAEQKSNVAQGNAFRAAYATH
ncbi:hypothetical protein [uncultured Agrobacterium sp.]|uniref:hypothetical protein n=1 Tax=uncultured Agrobacterium sp. TaxID=157277 RepID=UPI0025F383A3|nr:hypothetical protein [uncultured Agrobacterium sp.]